MGASFTDHPSGPPPAILLMGPTASGKTAVAADLAQRFPVEIVSVDSAQVFRGMDIGTAKPGGELLRRAPHHLIDIVDPTERYSAAQFVDDASELMAEITQRGNIPLLAGGTMLYFKALQEGLSAAARGRSGYPAGHRRDGRRIGLARAARRVGAHRSQHRGTARADRRAAHPARARGVLPHRRDLCLR